MRLVKEYVFDLNGTEDAFMREVREWERAETGENQIESFAQAVDEVVLEWEATGTWPVDIRWYGVVVRLERD
jgi:hypothetical protein